MDKIAKNASSNTLLLFAVIVLAFISGVLATRVWQLEKTIKNSNVAGADTAKPQETAEPTTQRINIEPGNLFVEGNKNAKVKIVVFNDFQCPFCKRFHEETINNLRKDYVETGKIALYFRHYPLPFHHNAVKAAEAAECANEQNKFKDYQDTLFTKQTEWEEKSEDEAFNLFISFAKDLSLNTDKFSTCLSEDKYKTAVEEDIKSAQEYGVSGTPTSFINGSKVVGAQPYPSFKSIIDQELNK